jgi:arginyl-tRNA synthetase
VAEILESGESFGRRPADRSAPPVLVEFVSANPTGPLHVGHARQAALGDAICNLLETQGKKVVREFYYNDAGAQIATLAASVAARLAGLAPGDAGWPADAYNGDYIADIAADFKAGKTVKADDRQFTASGRPDDLDGIRQFAVAYLRHEQDLDLAAFGVRFDNYYLESSLYTAAGSRRPCAGWSPPARLRGGGALCCAPPPYGDDKDRVMRTVRRAATPTSCPTSPTTSAKIERGFAATQHPGHRPPRHDRPGPRPGSARPAADVPKDYPDYVLNTMVPRGARRPGGQALQARRLYVTLRDLIEWTSKDAVRFFMLSRRPTPSSPSTSTSLEAQRREPGLLRAVRARPDRLGDPRVRGPGRRRRRPRRRPGWRGFRRRARSRC